MARHLRDRDVERIIGLLDGWQDKLSWELLSKACLPLIGTMPARQTLFRYPRIEDAFKATKERLKVTPPEVSVPPSMRVAMQRITRLTIEHDRLKRANDKLLEQFVVWQYNASIRGLSDLDLNMALPSIDRGNT